MRYAFVSDVHVWNHAECGGPLQQSVNRRGRQVCDALARAVRVAESYGCTWFVVLGDLFEAWRPEPQILAAVKRALTSKSMRIAMLVGNHDQVSTDVGDHAMVAVMPSFSEEHGGYIDQPVSLGAFAAFPYHSMGHDVWLKDTLSSLLENEHCGTMRGVGVHMGIRDGSTPAYLQGCPDAIGTDALFSLMEAFDIQATFAGHWHWHKKWKRDGRVIVQCGALVPNGWREKGMDDVGRMVVWDDGSQDVFVENIPGPRFFEGSLHEKPSWSSFFESLPQGEGWSYYMRMRASGGALDEASDTIQNLKEKGLIEDGRVFPDHAKRKASAQQISTGKDSANALDDTIFSYVQGLGVDREATRRSVMRRLRGYIDE